LTQKTQLAADFDPSKQVRVPGINITGIGAQMLKKA